jgi:GTP-binding protein
MIEQLFCVRQQLAGVVHIVDVRHPPSVADQRVRSWLRQWHAPVLLVATKVDKLGRTKRHSHLKLITEGLGLGEESSPILFSAHTGEGREKIWEWIRRVTGL